MLIFFIISLFLSIIILVKASDHVVKALRRLGRETHTKTFILSAILLAVSTSFPEMFVGITSALEGAPQLSFGDVLGSNIVNISLVAGVAALIAGRVHIAGEYVKKEVWLAAIAGILPLILIYDKYLSRIDGLMLLSAYGAYATSFFKIRFLQIAHQHRKEGYLYRFLRNFEHPIDEVIRHRREYGRLFIAIAVMLLSASLIVKVATTLAAIANIPIFLVGLVMVAIGTSLPELAFSIKSLDDHEPTMFLGNLLGSNIANSTLILGIVSTITPIKTNGLSEYLIAVIAYIVVFAAFWFFIRSKQTLERWEAAVLLLIYLAFVFVEIV
ncbi:sodium:calcium antiporter [Patescibacteria group bacterium]|nr:sodium:calcium antiporter [Patescibacteria group bacterium]